MSGKKRGKENSKGQGPLSFAPIGDKVEGPIKTGREGRRNGRVKKKISLASSLKTKRKRREEEGGGGDNKGKNVSKERKGGKTSNCA